MSEDSAERDAMTEGLPIKFSPSDTAIAEMRQAYMGLTIADVNDRDGYARVHEARMIVKRKRCDIENLRKQLKADALEYGRKVDSEAKRLTLLLEPIESHLTAEETRIDQEKESIRNAARLKAEAEERAKREAEEARIRAEQAAKEAAMRAEQERLAAERRALEAERAKIEAEKRRLAEEAAARQQAIEAEARRKAEAEAAQRRKIAEAEAAKVRAAELEKARQQAAEQARRETEASIKREAEERAAAEKRRSEAAEKKRLRAEALRPDKEKLLSLASAIESLKMPIVSPAGVSFAQKVGYVISDAVQQIRGIVNEME